MSKVSFSLLPLPELEAKVHAERHFPAAYDLVRKLSPEQTGKVYAANFPLAGVSTVQPLQKAPLVSPWIKSATELLRLSLYGYRIETSAGADPEDPRVHPHARYLGMYAPVGLMLWTSGLRPDDYAQLQIFSTRPLFLANQAPVIYLGLLAQRPS